nr:HAMP domain-containing protein [Ardenticatenales bacterium]
MDSLATKLTLAFLFVGLTGAILVALLVGWQTERQFDRFILELYQEEIATLNAQLQGYYQRTGSWEGVNSVAIREEGRSGHRHPWQPVTLVDANGIVISSGTQHQVGEQINARTLDGGVPIEVEGQAVGWLLVDSLQNRGKSQRGASEQSFLGNVWRATAWSALGAIGLALVVGAFLARTISRPVQELTLATQAVAQGELGRQVPVLTRDELGELAASFNRMSTDLAHATHLRRQMTANIAHDLRTPLSALLGYTEALSEGKFQGTPEIHRILHQEAQHLQHLIEDLRTLSLADAGELPLYQLPTPAEGLLERVALAHGAQAASQAVELTLEANERLPLLNVDPERMVQVLG